MNLGQRLLYPLLDWRARRVAAQVARYLTDAATVLDFGTGNGLISRHIRERTTSYVVGVDTIPYPAAPIDLILYDGSTLPFADNSFDTVLSLFVLHHCEQPEAALDECLRVADRHVLVIEDVYDGSLSKALLLADDWLANRVETSTVNVPFNFRTVPMWRETFAKRGLRLEAEERVWPLPHHPIMSVLFYLSKSRST